MSVFPVSQDDVRRAASGLAGVVTRTPLLENPDVNDTLGGRLLINKALLAGALVASDNAVRDAMRFAFEHYKIVIEPGAAVGISAVLNGQTDISGQAATLILKGFAA